ncbi:MAG: CRISPR-associated ring nuclease [Caldilineaceae bacterium]
MTTTFPGCTMIATLGGKPELVTLALDALLAAGEAVDEVIVLHPSAAMPRIRAALQTLQGVCLPALPRAPLSFPAYCAATGRSASCPIFATTARPGDPTDDPRSDCRAEAARSWRLVYRGRRAAGQLLVMAGAALLCDHRDRLWHLYSSDAFQGPGEGAKALLHADGADVRLVPVLVPWGTYFPALRAIAQTPQEAVAGQMAWLTGANDEQCQAVYDELTEAATGCVETFAGVYAQGSG